MDSLTGLSTTSSGYSDGISPFPPTYNTSADSSSQPSTQAQSASPLTYFNAQSSTNALVIEQTITSSSSGSSSDAATVDFQVDNIYKSLSISAQQLVQKLNELLKGKLPNGLEGVAPEDVTPEKTANTVVNGIGSLFTKYKESNPELSPEEAITRFFAAARKGVEQGFGDASKVLGDLGAFGFDGVQEGIGKTKGLIASKLDELEKQKRKEAGLDTAPVEKEVADATTTALLGQAGATVKSSATQAPRLDIAA